MLHVTEYAAKSLNVTVIGLVPFDILALHTSSYFWSIVTMTLSCIISEIKRMLVKNRDLSYPCIRRPLRNISIRIGVEKLEWRGYASMKKSDDLFSCFDSTGVLRTDILRQHSPRGNKMRHMLCGPDT